jgi:Flp pilus assembly protein TadD
MHLGSRAKSFLFIAAVVFVTFAAVLRFGFLEHDDDQHITKNPELQSLSLDQLTTFWTAPHLGLYIPVTYSYWAAGVAVSRIGKDPNTPVMPSAALFHGGNMVLHALNGYLLWLILGALGATPMAALLGSLLFILHPMQVEAVAWISGAKDLLCGFFALSGTLVFLRFMARDRQRPCRWPVLLGFYLGATLLGITAILAKPAAVALPLVFFVLAMIYSRRPWWQHLAMVMPQLVVGLIVVKMTAGAQVAEGPVPDIVWWLRSLVAGDAILFYLRQIIWPFSYAVDYARRPDVVLGDTVSCCLAVIPWLGLAFLGLKYRRWPLPFFAAVVFVLLLLPNLGFLSFAFQFMSTVCDRYAYLAMAVPAFLLSRLSAEHLARFLPKTTKARDYYYAALGAVLALLGGLSAYQVRFWANEYTLFQHSVDAEPKGVMAIVGLGNDAANKLHWEDSITYFSRALAIRPDWGRVHNNLGNSYINVNRLVEATDELRRAIELFPNYPLAYNNLCGALARREMWGEASAACLNALRLAPDFQMPYQNLGYIAAKQNNYAKAEEYLRAAVAIAPTDIPPRTNLVSVLKLQGRWEKAAEELEILTRMRPRDLGLAMDLASCYQKLGQLDKARGVYTNFPVDPSDERAAATLHAALDGMGRYH